MMWLPLAHLYSWGNHRACGRHLWCQRQTWQRRKGETVDTPTLPAPCVSTRRTSDRSHRKKREEKKKKKGSSLAWQWHKTSSWLARCVTLNLVERQNPLDFLQVLLGDLQALLLGQAALTGQTGAEQQLGAVVHLSSRKNRAHVR